MGNTFLTAAALAIALRPVPTDDALINLARTRKPGDATRYQVKAVAEVGGLEVTIDRTVRVDVKEVRENGDVVTITSDLGGKVSAMGQEIASPKLSRLNATTDKLGRLTKFQRSTDEIAILSPESEQLLAIVQDYTLPDKPVKVGDTWTHELANPLVKDAKITVKGTLKGEETVDGTVQRLIRHTVEAVVDAEGSKVKADMLFYVDPTTGGPIRFEGKAEGVPTQYGTLNFTFKALLLKPEPTPQPDKAP
ncbi:MAG: hypothetical protein HUU17_02055 [Chthonomonadales bacterium]|nr:hypothetical protein [Chthonomonadales bacterium]